MSLIRKNRLKTVLPKTVILVPKASGQTNEIFKFLEISKNLNFRLAIKNKNLGKFPKFFGEKFRKFSKTSTGFNLSFSKDQPTTDRFQLQKLKLIGVGLSTCKKPEKHVKIANILRSKIFALLSDKLGNFSPLIKSGEKFPSLERYKATGCPNKI